MPAPAEPSHRLAARMHAYAAWLDRHRWAVVLASAALMVVVYLVGRVPLRSDLSSLLPPAKPSVRDLEVLKGRARTFGNVIVMLEAPTAADRARLAPVLVEELRALDPALISTVSLDDHAAVRYGWEHRFLFVELADLEDAIAALRERLTRARLDANPLFIDLDDEPAAGSAAAPPPDRLADLERKLDEAEATATSPAARLSPDGRAQLIMLQVTFPSSNIPLAKRVMGKVRALAARFEAAHPGAQILLAGSINIAIFDHDSVISGMSLAALLTVLLCALGLVYYFRTGLGVLAVLWALALGVGATLAFTALAIGHLNIMTAFLTAIIVGNGVNSGLVLLARYLEERRAGHGPTDALGPALAGALPGTLGAALTAAVAYGSLIVTDFRGFRHFGVIGAVGMLACWVAAYTVLPALLAVLGRAGRIRVAPPSALGALLGRLLPRRLGLAVWGGVALTVVATAASLAYILTDPFAKDWRVLQSESDDILAQRQVDAQMTARFGKARALSGHSFQIVIAVTDRAQVRPLVRAIRAAEAARPDAQKLFAEIRSIDDLVPPDQEAKLARHGDVRALLDDPAIAQLTDEERARFARLRPPEGLRVLTDRDVPPDVLAPFVEQDGSVGRLIFLKGSPRFRTWNVDDRIAFARGVRQLEMPPGAVIGGEPLVIADIVAAMEEDAPRMIVLSLLGSILGVWLVVGFRRHGRVTIFAGLAGVMLMIALCAAIDLPVHFLDVIALPITIGIGIDYAVNLAARDREEGEKGPRHLLATTGGAVLLCSYTTTVGYASLLLSANGGIRAFGLAALLGEIACLIMALIVAPALLAVLRARDVR